MRMNRAALLCVCGLLLVGPSRAEDDLTSEDAKGAVEEYLKAKTGPAGTFGYKDQQADAQLELAFDRVRLVRRIEGYGFFVDVDFHAQAEAARAYDIDFWLKPANGKLEVVDIRIHKAPKREGEAFKLVTRSPLPWWWIPATEHPGETEEKKGWQIESAVNEHIARAIQQGVLSLKDDVGGISRELDFVEIHRPLRKIEGRGYFACTDFREHGSKDK